MDIFAAQTVSEPKTLKLSKLSQRTEFVRRLHKDLYLCRQKLSNRMEHAIFISFDDDSKKGKTGVSTDSTLVFFMLVIFIIIKQIIHSFFYQQPNVILISNKQV